MSEATATPVVETNVNAEAARGPRVKFPQPETFVFRTKEECEAAKADIKAKGGRDYRIYLINLTGDDLYAMEINPLVAAGRAAEFLNLKVESLNRPARRAVPVRTADEFLTGFTTLSDDDRAKILAALKDQLKGTSTSAGPAKKK